MCFPTKIKKRLLIKRITGRKNPIAGSAFKNHATAKLHVSLYCKNKFKHISCLLCNLYFQITKYKSTVITSVLPTARKNAAIFERSIWNYSPFFKICLSIPRLHAEPLRRFCGNRAGKSCLREKSSVISEQVRV